MENLEIASLMICSAPRRLGKRQMLSAFDGVWEPLSRVDCDLAPYLTDEVGNCPPSYAGSLQMTSSALLDVVKGTERYLCFRGVQRDVLEFLDVVPNTLSYHSIEDEFVLVGWDVCSGNGFLSASCHGIYPIDPFTGSDLDESVQRLNNVGLFKTLKQCVGYCAVNDKELPEHSPWFPVGVLITRFDQEHLGIKI